MENKFHGQFGEVLVIKDLFDDFDIPKTCIEFGAYDGITNSNTYYFWKKKDFKALLIEPNQELFKVLLKNANKNCTLVNKSITTGKSLNKIIQLSGTFVVLFVEIQRSLRISAVALYMRRVINTSIVAIIVGRVQPFPTFSKSWMERCTKIMH